VICVEAGDEKAVLACFEEGLRYRRLGAVVAEVGRLSMTASRRLQLAAEGSGVIGLALRRWRRQAEAADFGRPTSRPSASRETRSSVGRLRDLCFGDDLTDFLIAEWRAEDVHADVGGDSPQLGYVSGKKAPPLDILEEAFETAWGERRREADTLGTISPPGVRTELRQKNQITRCKNEGKIRRPNDCLALDQFKNLILPVMKMSRRPEAGRSAIVKNGELPPAVGGANGCATPRPKMFATQCPTMLRR